jgi:nicotinate-nucleotide adenylyltransferase
VHYRIGILGGSFDPIHLAHIEAARTAREFSVLDFVYLVPAGNPYHREPLAGSAAARLAMCELAAQEHNWLKVTEVDVVRSGNTYTVDTLTELREEFEQLQPGDSAEWFLILGADAYRDFPQWKEPELISREASILVVARPGENHTQHESFPCTFIDIPGWEISSSGIRQRLEQGESIEGLVTPSVRKYITQHNLYASSPKTANHGTTN